MDLRNEREFHTYRGYMKIRQDNIKLTPSMEDYLEMIYRNCLNGGYIRMSNLAEQLNVQVPSATKIVQKLSEMGLLQYEKYGIIQLTKKGEKVGRFLLKRHRIVECFLKNLGVKDNVLTQVEMIEHYLGVDTVENIDMLNNFFEDNPDVAERFLQFKKPIL